jgi:hypothetical protein
MRFYLLIACFFIVSITKAQTTLKGTVFEFQTRITLSGIQVQNTVNNRSTTTDDKGRFSIAAKNGDILVFKSFAYNTDTVLVTDLHEKEIFLVPRNNLLEEVKVVTDSIKNPGLSYDPMFHGQTVVYTRDANLNPTGGLTIRIWDSKKDQHKREKLERKLQDQQVQDKINRAFAPANIAKYVPLKGKDLDGFIALYTPTVKEYNSNDFVLAVYLSDCYKKYLKLPEDKRHPPNLDDSYLIFNNNN